MFSLGWVIRQSAWWNTWRSFEFISDQTKRVGGNTIEKLVVRYKWVCFWKNILTGSANGEPNRIQNKSRYFIKTMGWENVTNSFSTGELGLGFRCDEIYLRSCCHILLLTLSEFKRINYLLFSLKSSENLWFSDDFRENRS